MNTNSNVILGKYTLWWVNRLHGTEEFILTYLIHVFREFILLLFFCILFCISFSINFYISLLPQLFYPTNIHTPIRTLSTSRSKTEVVDESLVSARRCFSVSIFILQVSLFCESTEYPYVKIRTKWMKVQQKSVFNTIQCYNKVLNRVKNRLSTRFHSFYSNYFVPYIRCRLVHRSRTIMK